MTPMQGVRTTTVAKRKTEFRAAMVTMVMGMDIKEKSITRFTE